MAIEAAIRKAMSEPFRKRIEGQKHPYGAGNTSEQICHHLKQVCLDHPIKQFYDLENGKFSAHDEEK
jgi:UDP-N-acetylglucosamine 2-epimerase